MDPERKLYKEALRPLMPDFETVRRTVKVQSKGAGQMKKKHGWIAGLAGACAALLLCTAVPPVRAAIMDLFYGKSEETPVHYVSTPSEERTAIENVSVQTVEAQPWTVRTYRDSEFPWADDIAEVRVEEALYDAGELTLKYTVDGSAVHLEGGRDLAIRAFNGELSGTVPAIGTVFVFDGSEDIADIEVLSKDGPEPVGAEEDRHEDQGTEVVDNEDGSLTLTSTFDVGALEGDQDLVLLIQCCEATVQEDGAVWYDTLGFLQLPFSVEDGETPIKSAELKSYMINGKELEITEATLSPTGLKIGFITPSDIFPTANATFEIYADGNKLTSGDTPETDSFMTSLVGIAEGKMEGSIRVPFLNNRVTRIELIPVDQGSRERLSEDAIVIDFA